MRRAPLLALALVAAGCGPDGALGVLAGSPATREGVEIALEELPADRRPTVVAADASGVAATLDAFRTLADAGATLVVGPAADEPARGAAALAGRLRVPFVATGALAPDVSAGNPWAMHAGPPVERLAAALARFARGDPPGLERVAILVDLSDERAVRFATAFRAAFLARGGRLPAERGFVPGGAPAALGELLAAGHRAVLVAAAAADLDAAVRAAPAAALAGTVLLGGPGWDEADLGPLLRGRVAGAYHAGPFSDRDPTGRGSAFARRYAERTGRRPPAEAALAYDAARAALAVFDPDADGEAHRRRLAALRDVEGVTGPLRFEPGAAAARPVVVQQLHDGARPAFVARLLP